MKFLQKLKGVFFDEVKPTTLEEIIHGTQEQEKVSKYVFEEVKTINHPRKGELMRTSLKRPDGTVDIMVDDENSSARSILHIDGDGALCFIMDMRHEYPGRIPMDIERFVKNYGYPDELKSDVERILAVGNEMPANQP